MVQGSRNRKLQLQLLHDEGKEAENTSRGIFNRELRQNASMGMQAHLLWTGFTHRPHHEHKILIAASRIVFDLRFVWLCIDHRNANCLGSPKS